MYGYQNIRGIKTVLFGTEGYGSTSGSHLLTTMYMPIISTEFETGIGFNNFGRGNSCFASKSLDGNTVFWYSNQDNGSQYQFNAQGYVYYYIAFG